MRVITRFLGGVVTLTLLLGACLGTWEDADVGDTTSGFFDQEVDTRSPGLIESQSQQHPILVTWNAARRKALGENSLESIPLESPVYVLTRKDQLPLSSQQIRKPFPAAILAKYYPSQKYLGLLDDTIKYKRYLGMEIPEYITKNDGTGGNGGTTQRGMKQKLLNSG